MCIYYIYATTKSINYLMFPKKTRNQISASNSSVLLPPMCVLKRNKFTWLRSSNNNFTDNSRRRVKPRFHPCSVVSRALQVQLAVSTFEDELLVFVSFLSTCYMFKCVGFVTILVFDLSLVLSFLAHSTWRFYSKSAFLFKHSRIWSLVAQVVRRIFSLGGYEKFSSVCFSFLFECRRCPSARLQSSERSLRAQRSHVESGKWCWFGFE